MYIKVKQGINVNIYIINQVTWLDAIVIKVIMHEWAIFMQMKNMTFADTYF